jgi:glycerol-3-phosphate responsive antiterminator
VRLYVLTLIPLILFGSIDIDEHTRKWINPNKKYEISGQHILNTIDTVDSLENIIDSLSKNNRSVDTFTLYDTLIWTQLDTLYDTVYLNTQETIYDTVHIDVVKTKEQLNQTYRFIITMVVVIGFLSIMIYASMRSY